MEIRFTGNIPFSPFQTECFAFCFDGLLWAKFISVKYLHFPLLFAERNRPER